MLGNCITYSICWYNTLHPILPVARKYHITTRRFEMLVHTTDSVDLAFILGLRASNLNSNSIGIPFANFNSTLAICLKLFLLKCQIIYYVLNVLVQYVALNIASYMTIPHPRLKDSHKKVNSVINSRIDQLGYGTPWMVLFQTCVLFIIICTPCH